MAKKPQADCLGTTHPLVKRFLKTFGCRLVDQADLVKRFQGKDWPWVAQWIKEEGPKYVNDMATLVFEIPLSNLTGGTGLHFTQDVWMFQPSLFEYLVLDDRGIVRIWWDQSRGAFPYNAAP